MKEDIFTQPFISAGWRETNLEGNDDEYGGYERGTIGQSICKKAYDEKGNLVSFQLVEPEEFVFAYDVVDRLAQTSPTPLPCSGATTPARSTISPSAT